MWPVLYLPKGEPRYEKSELRQTNLSGLFLDLEKTRFTGQVEVLSPHEHGLLIWRSGQYCNGFFDGTEDLQLSPLQVAEHFCQTKGRDTDTAVSVNEIPEAILESLGGLQVRRPLYRELETSFLDMDKLFQTLTAKEFTGCLRFYRVRSHTRLGNILVKMNKISRDQLQQAVRLQLARKQGLRLGDALVEIGAIGADDLKSALDLQSHARKGSDVEVAIAVFSHGRMLGSYTHLHKQFDPNREGIRPQLAGAEILMDIIEGGLPPAIPLDALLRPTPILVLEVPAAQPEAELQAAPPAPLQPAPSAPPEPPVEDLAEAPPEIKPESDDLFLRGEELLMDTSLDLTGLADAVPASLAGAPAAATVPPAAAPEPVAQPVPNGNLSALPESLQGYPYMQAVTEQFLGPLGRKLLEHEAKGLHGTGREWSLEQLVELNDNLLRSASFILGTGRARAMTDKIRERLS